MCTCLPVYLSTPLCTQRLIQIPENIFDILQSYGEADEIGTDARSFLLFLGKLRMRCAGGVDGQGLCITEVFKMAEQLQIVNKPCAGFTPALDAETKHRA